MKKEISIIIPCYNVERYIDRCLLSLLGQTVGTDKMEVICVNDASVDRTLEHLLRWENAHPGLVTVIDSKINRGIGGARNLGMARATGDYISFVDADDWLELTMYEKMYHAIKTYGCDIVRCRHIRDPGTGNIWDTSPMRAEPDSLFLIPDEDERRKFMAADLMDCGCTNKLYTSSIIFDHDIRFVENLAYEDVPWGILFYLYADSVYFLNEHLYHYFVNPESVVLAVDKAYHMDLLKTSLLKWKECKKRGALEKYRKEMELSFLVTYYLGGMKMLALRYTDYKYSVFRKMCETVTTLIPDYSQNPYIGQTLTEMYRLWLSLIGADITLEEYKAVVNLIRSMGKA